MTWRGQPPARMADVATPGVGWHRAYLALGSNLLQPQQQVLRTILALQQIPGIVMVAVSSLYQSAAWGAVSAQPDYINAVAAIDTTLDPESLLSATMRIEQDHGRVRGHERNAARTIDIDILLYDNLAIDSARLTLPHPRMHERAFVLRPLAEIAPGAEVPGHGKAADLLQAMPPAAINAVHPVRQAA